MSLIDDLKTPKPWNRGTPADGVTMYNETVKPLDDNIRLVASAVDNLPQPSEQVQANWNTSAASDPSFIQNKPTIPSKTSQLQNDAGFITSNDIPSVPTKTSELQNDSGFITSADVPVSRTQSNWACEDEDDPSFIQNKPEVVGATQADWSVPHSATYNPACILNKPETPEEWNAAGAAPYYHASKGINYGISYFNTTTDYKYGHVLSLPGFDFDADNWSAYSGAGKAWVGGPQHTHSKLRMHLCGRASNNFQNVSPATGYLTDGAYDFSEIPISGSQYSNIDEKFAGIAVYDVQFTITKFQNSASNNVVPLRFTLMTKERNTTWNFPITDRTTVISYLGTDGSRSWTCGIQGLQGEDFVYDSPIVGAKLAVQFPPNVFTAGDSFSASLTKTCYGSTQKKGTQLSSMPG